MKSRLIALIIIGIILFSLIIYFALTAPVDSVSYHIPPIELKVAQKLQGGSVWYFSGTVIDSETEIKMSVRSPDGNIITTDTIIPDEYGNFETELTTGGPLWANVGKYILILEQGEFKEIQIFEILEHEIPVPLGKQNEKLPTSTLIPEPFPSKCKSGPSPGDNYYYDEDLCEWELEKSLDEYSVKELLEKPHLIPIRDSNENQISLISDSDKSGFSCASLSLVRISDDKLQYYIKENQTSPHFFSMTQEELDTHPELKLLIAASNLLEFPYNDGVHFYFKGVDFVEYEFFLVDKIIEKYGGTRGDYITLDSDYEERLTNPKKQGFTNKFEAPQIIYNDKIYQLSGTHFWTSDESNLDMSLHLRDTINEKRKIFELTDEDMIYLPKIKDAINKMGKTQENIHANIGIKENPNWNDYRDWYGNKMTDGMKNDKDYENAFSGFTFDGQFYTLGFPIC